MDKSFLLAHLTNLTQLVIKSEYPVYALHFLANRIKYHILPLTAIQNVQTRVGNFNKRISPRSFYQWPLLLHLLVHLHPPH